MGIQTQAGPGVRNSSGLGLACFAVLGLARPVAAQDTHLIVIVGVGGDEEHSARFHKWASAVVDAAKKRGVPPRTSSISARAEQDPAHVNGARDEGERHQGLPGRREAREADDELFVLLIGHGSFDGKMGAFNLPGPDLTAGDYATLLDLFKTQKITFVNTASASGAFLQALAGPNRAIVAATKTGGERNETRFPEFFVEALERRGRRHAIATAASRCRKRSTTRSRR